MKSWKWEIVLEIFGVECARFARSTASPSRREAGWKPEEGGTDKNSASIALPIDSKKTKWYISNRAIIWGVFYERRNKN